MLLRRLTHLLLILAVTLWGSGEAQALHQRFEHASDPAHASFVGEAAHAHSHAHLHADADHERHPPIHDHGECPTCAVLAAMVATVGVVVFFQLQCGENPLARAAPSVSRPPSPRVLPCVSNRGPPPAIAVG